MGRHATFGFPEGKRRSPDLKQFANETLIGIIGLSGGNISPTLGVSGWGNWSAPIYAHPIHVHSRFPLPYSNRVVLSGSLRGLFLFRARQGGQGDIRGQRRVLIEFGHQSAPGLTLFRGEHLPLLGILQKELPFPGAQAGELVEGPDALGPLACGKAPKREQGFLDLMPLLF